MGALRAYAARVFWRLRNELDPVSHETVIGRRFEDKQGFGVDILRFDGTKMSGIIRRRAIIPADKVFSLP